MKMKKSEKEIVNPFLFAHIENVETEDSWCYVWDFTYTSYKIYSHIQMCM